MSPWTLLDLLLQRGFGLRQVRIVCARLIAWIGRQTSAPSIMRQLDDLMRQVRQLGHVVCPHSVKQCFSGFLARMSPFSTFNIYIRRSSRARSGLVYEHVANSIGVVAPCQQLPGVGLISVCASASCVEDEALRSHFRIEGEVGVDLSIIWARCVPRGQIVVDLTAVCGLWKDRRAVKFEIPKWSIVRVARKGDLPVAVEPGPDLLGVNEQ